MRHYVDSRFNLLWQLSADFRANLRKYYKTLAIFNYIFIPHSNIKNKKET